MDNVKRWLSINIKELVTLGITIVILIAALIINPNLLKGGTFFSLANSILMWFPVDLTIAMGMMMVIIIRDIDLSVGSTLAFCSILMGRFYRDIAPGMGIPEGPAILIGILIALSVGLLCGLLNGVLIAYLKIPAIIVTLGTINMYRGLAYIVSGQYKQIVSKDLPPGLSKIFIEKGLTLGPLNFPWFVLISLLIAAFFFFMLKYTHFGREVYAVGSNREGALLRGINCKKTELLIFTITGLLAGITAPMLAARFGQIAPKSTGDGREFVVLTATIIGGVSVSGGKGTVPGVFLGCLLLGTVNSVLPSVGITGEVQRFSYGLIVVLALLLDQGMTVMRAKARIAELQKKKNEIPAQAVEGAV
jgi:rhamnose transport system permease protein